MPPGSKHSAKKEIQSEFGEVAVDVQKHGRQGRLVRVGNIFQELGRQGTRLRTLDNMGEYQIIKMGPKQCTEVP